MSPAPPSTWTVAGPRNETFSNETFGNETGRHRVMNQIGIGLIGYSFMGRAHTAAWRNVTPAFDLQDSRPALRAICGRDGPLVEAAARRLGWASWETDWRAVVARDDIDVVDVCTPGALHAEIAVAALEAGKHVLCEKPMANSVAEAVAMADAAERAAAFGVTAMVGFNYRRVPAAALAAQLVGAGRLGVIRHVRASYLQDWLVDPNSPMSWRLQKEVAGSGALGDLGSHIVDLAQHLTGQTVTDVSALTETFVPERPVSSAGWGAGTGAVTVDDAVVFIGRLSGGGTATFEASRFATGRKNSLRIEINGERASLAFDLERLNELEIYDASEGDLAGARRVLVTQPDHPYVQGWWPPGHVLGWDHSFVNEVRDFLDAVRTGQEASPSFSAGLAVQRVLAAVELSAAERTWVAVDGIDKIEARRH
jgi:predicted dehydrogenase